MFDALKYGITGRALEQTLLNLHHWDPRDFCHDKHRQVDDRPYGGGPGMLMKVQPLRDAIIAAKHRLGSDTRTILLSPQGKRIDQQKIAEVHNIGKFIFVAGRYEGVDERLIELEIDEQWSIGDYVISGGELATMVVIDALTRMIPGALGHAQSAEQDSFIDGLLDFPQYTRPACCDNLAVPDVLLGGDHQAIHRWRLKQAIGRTWLRRPDLLEQRQLTNEEIELLAEFKQECEEE